MSAKSLNEKRQTPSGKSEKSFDLAEIAKHFPLAWSHYVLLLSCKDENERKVLAKEYKTVLPNEKVLIEEIEKNRKMLNDRKI